MLQTDGLSFFDEHGECPTCGRCRCCGQDQLSFPGLSTFTTSVGLSEELDPLDKLIKLIDAVRCDSSYPVDQKTLEDIINGQAETE